jgi:hypothetical protein
MARTLKVFRTSTGFHDAYVAAPSRAAALRAWGSDNDLFARGAAEEICDPKLMAEPLANPGEVIRKSRGSLEEQLAALPKDEARHRSPQSIEAHGPKPKKPVARPPRARLAKAEAALAALEERQRAELEALTKREDALRRERRLLEEDQASEREKLDRALSKAKAAYDTAIARWQSEG